MTTNLDRFKNDLEGLIQRGSDLEFAVYYENTSKEDQDNFALSEDGKDWLKRRPRFDRDYQIWYSEALALLKQLLPDRVADFVRHYEKPKGRKEVTFESYRIEDALQGLVTKRGDRTIVSPKAAGPHVAQQVAIVESARARFESSLFEIRQIVQADMFDSELEAAEALAKHRFYRAAGALAGVVLEKHLHQVCADHNVLPGKKNPGISDFNESLKTASVISVPDWRFIQHLADIRNTCDHARGEPTPAQVEDLIAGVKKTIKTIH